MKTLGFQTFLLTTEASLGEFFRFKRVKQVYNFKDSLQLTLEQKTFIEKQYKGFSRNGANLSKIDKKIYDK